MKAADSLIRAIPRRLKGREVLWCGEIRASLTRRAHQRPTFFAARRRHVALRRMKPTRHSSTVGIVDGLGRCQEAHDALSAASALHRPLCDR